MYDFCSCFNHSSFEPMTAGRGGGALTKIAALWKKEPWPVSVSLAPMFWPDGRRRGCWVHRVLSRPIWWVDRLAKTNTHIETHTSQQTRSAKSIPSIKMLKEIYIVETRQKLRPPHGQNNMRSLTAKTPTEQYSVVRGLKERVMQVFLCD